MDYTLLNNAGVDCESALRRFMGNEILFAKTLKKFLEDCSFSSLSAAAAANNSSEALSHSQTLKGICGNLSMNELYELFSAQVVLMRSGKWKEAYEMLPDITEKYRCVTEAIEQWFMLEEDGSEKT